MLTTNLYFIPLELLRLSYIWLWGTVGKREEPKAESPHLVGPMLVMVNAGGGRKRERERGH